MFSHKTLINIAYLWALKRSGGFCGVAFREFKTLCHTGEQPDVLGFRSCGSSVLIEVKISRADFLCDKNKKFRSDPNKGMGRYRFYMCPWGLIYPEDLPEGWGLIWVNLDGKPRIMINPYCVAPNGNIWNGGFNQNLLAENELMYSALRRLHLRGLIDLVYEPAK